MDKLQGLSEFIVGLDIRPWYLDIVSMLMDHYWSKHWIKLARKTPPFTLETILLLECYIVVPLAPFWCWSLLMFAPSSHLLHLIHKATAVQKTHTPAAFYDESTPHPTPIHIQYSAVIVFCALILAGKKNVSECAFQRLQHYKRKHQSQMKASLLIRTSSSILFPFRALLTWWHMF